MRDLQYGAALLWQGLTYPAQGSIGQQRSGLYVGHILVEPEKKMCKLMQDYGHQQQHTDLLVGR